MVAILDFAWSPWLQVNTGIVNEFFDPNNFRLETLFVTLAFILVSLLVHIFTVFVRYANKMQPTWI